ncbi:MAG: hypothetical protein HFJ02_07015 [Bacilli bacterium]|nr:hypothetical protein [Bacilli bacterium]
MLTLNIFKTFYEELIDFFKDIKDLFIDILSNIHIFLNKFIPDEIILGLLICLAAFIAIMIFRYVINKR